MAVSVNISSTRSIASNRTICRQSPSGVLGASWNGNTSSCRDQPGGTVHLMRVAHHKLVRDQIPAIIAADGGQPVTRVLDHAGYEAALRAQGPGKVAHSI